MVRLQRWCVVCGAGEVDCRGGVVLVIDVADIGVSSRVEGRRPRNSLPFLLIVIFLQQRRLAMHDEGHDRIIVGRTSAA